MCVSINKQLIIFQNYLGVASRLSHGKGSRTFLHFKCFRGQRKSVSRVTCRPMSLANCGFIRSATRQYLEFLIYQLSHYGFRQRKKKQKYVSLCKSKGTNCCYNYYILYHTLFDARIPGWSTKAQFD